MTTRHNTTIATALLILVFLEACSHSTASVDDVADCLDSRLTSEAAWRAYADILEPQLPELERIATEATRAEVAGAFGGDPQQQEATAAAALAANDRLSAIQERVTWVRALGSVSPYQHIAGARRFDSLANDPGVQVLPAAIEASNEMWAACRLACADLQCSGGVLRGLLGR
jgi:hypothetical protein